MLFFFFFQAEDGIRDRSPSRGLGDVYKRQELIQAIFFDGLSEREVGARFGITQSVVNKRKARILRKLRKIIEN